MANSNISIQDFDLSDQLRHAVRWQDGFQLMVYSFRGVEDADQVGVKVLITPDAENNPEQSTLLEMNDDVAYELARGLIKATTASRWQMLKTLIKVFVSK